MKGSLRQARHRYCCVDRAMTQASIGTIPDSAARCKSAWFLRAISEACLPRDRDCLPAASLPCPANPISGRARPILDQCTKAVFAASSGVVRLRALARSNESLSTSRVLTPHHAARPDYIGISGRHLNGFFAISVNSPSMSMVNFCCCVGLAPKAVRSVTRRVTPQPMRAAVWMKAGDHACL
jgi:hypothetical protein